MLEELFGNMKVKPVLLSDERLVQRWAVEFRYLLGAVPLCVPFFSSPRYRVYRYHFLLQHLADSCVSFRRASLITQTLVWGPLVFVFTAFYSLVNVNLLTFLEAKLWECD